MDTYVCIYINVYIYVILYVDMYGYVCMCMYVYTDFWEGTGGSCHAVERAFCT